MSKLLRCAFEGCRTLTAAGGLCDKHKTPEPDPAEAAKAERWREMLAEASRRAAPEIEAKKAEIRAREQRQAEFSRRREDLSDLREFFARAERAAERPTFAEEDHA